MLEHTTSLEAKRHTLAHLMAAAVQELYPDALLTIGPAVDNGFYYDIAFTAPPSENDLRKIEKQMKKLINGWDEMTGKVVTAEEAREVFKDNKYKLELINEIAAKGEAITLYTAGTGHHQFTDLCRGGHCKRPKDALDMKAFKLAKLAGAYWRGDEKNDQLTRIYGYAFETKEELVAYKRQLEEAKKRDHRKLGKELNLFFIDEMVGKGLVMWLPKGALLRDQVEKLALDKERAAGYEHIYTPHLAKEELYLTSGHLPYYKDDMYPAMKMDDGTYYLRAMNCPHHHRVFTHAPKSYRDLPMRLAEYGTVYRNERSGTLAGLLRVRGLTMNDAHIYCRKDQIKEEFTAVMNLIIEYFSLFGLENYWFRLSKWDPEHTEKYIDEPDNWKFSEGVIREVLDEMKVDYVEVEDEAAFYGPKVDVQFTSVIGREETMSTVQLDFLAKKRFDFTYTDQDGNDNKEVFVIHRAPLSTHERFIAFLIEHFAGAFPLWLAPVQMVIIPVSDKFSDYGTKVLTQLQEAGYRVEIDNDSETLGKRIRAAQKEKIPYMLVVGEKEVSDGTVAVRSREKGDEGIVKVDTFIEKIQKEL